MDEADGDGSLDVGSAGELLAGVESVVGPAGLDELAAGADDDVDGVGVGVARGIVVVTRRDEPALSVGGCGVDTGCGVALRLPRVANSVAGPPPLEVGAAGAGPGGPPLEVKAALGSTGIDADGRLASPEMYRRLNASWLDEAEGGDKWPPC